MIKSSGTISEVKEIIKKMQDEKVEVVLNLGRNKFVKFNATLSAVYPALFTVIPDNKEFSGKTTYSYSDCICGNVKIKKLTESAQ